MKPLVKWSGGKSDEIKYFLRYIPKYKLYIEPFIGGGALYFYLNSKNNVINDIHTDLVNFYQQIKLGNGIEIYKLMKQYNNDESTYYYIRDKFVPKNDVEKAFVFFYLRKTCYRGMLRYNKKGKFNIPFGRYKTYNYEILLDTKYKDLLSRTIIHNNDVGHIFERYNSNDNFVFLDPPYDSEFTDYGYCKYDRNNHLKLYEWFISTNNKCMIIIGCTTFIENLYKDYIVDSYHKKYNFKIHSGRVGNEINKNHLIIINYQIDTFF